MITFTIIERIEDAGIQTRVFLIQGESFPRVYNRVSDAYEQMIGRICKDLCVDSSDNYISEGVNVNGKWIDKKDKDVDDIWGTRWVEEGANGYIEWKYDDGTTLHRITVLPPEQITIIEVK